MKRLLVLLAIVGLVVALPLSHSVLAKGDKAPAKVEICHATDSAALQSGGTLIVGHVISVSERAVDAHLAHGDSLDINALGDPGPWAGHTWGQLAEWYELDLVDVNCAARLP